MKKIVVLFIVALMVLGLTTSAFAQTVPGTNTIVNDTNVEDLQALADALLAGLDLDDVILVGGGPSEDGAALFTENAIAPTLPAGKYFFNISTLGGASCADLVVYKVSSNGVLDFFTGFTCDPATGLVEINTLSVGTATFVIDTSGVQFDFINPNGGVAKRLTGPQADERARAVGLSSSAPA